MAGCLFCRILAGELLASVAHQDEHCLVIMDIHPLQPGHALILPRRHAARLDEFDAAERGHLFALAARVMAGQRAAGLAPDGGNLLLNDGSAANQHIPHLHLHCIPRRRGDSLAVGARMLSRMVNLFGFAAGRECLEQSARTLAQALSEAGG